MEDMLWLLLSLFETLHHERLYRNIFNGIRFIHQQPFFHKRPVFIIRQRATLFLIDDVSWRGFLILIERKNLH